MKLRTLIAAIVVVALFLFAGMLYAANGDLIVNGNLGVGTSTPAAKAEVNGNMQVDGNMTVQGNLVTNGTASLGGNATVNGNVGIGTMSPNARLDVSGAGGSQIRISDSTNTSSLRCAIADDTGTITAAKNGAVPTAINFTTQISSGTTTTTLSLKAGNVGIGTTTPTQKLDVNGAVKATGYYSGSSAGISNSIPYYTYAGGACQSLQCYTSYADFTNGLLTGTHNVNWDCGPCGSCFRSGTNILLADGSTKRIEDITVGEVLLGEDGSKNKVLALDRHPLGKRNFYGINKGPYFVTEDHPFMTTAGWKSINPSMTAESTKMPVGKLGVGGTLVTKNGPVKITSLADQKSTADTVVYNFVLDGTKSYFADGFLVRAYNDKAGQINK